MINIEYNVNSEVKWKIHFIAVAWYYLQLNKYGIIFHTLEMKMYVPPSFLCLQFQIFYAFKQTHNLHTF